MTSTVTEIRHVNRVREAARALGAASTDTRNAVLRSLATELRSHANEIIAMNADDVLRAREAGTSDALLDRLLLNDERMDQLIEAVEQVASLDDPLGEVVEARTLDNGLRLHRVRVPFGVVCVVYEARPNVTADAAAIAIKTGNGIVLRGSSQAVLTNRRIVECVGAALERHGISQEAVWNFPPDDRDAFRELIATEGGVDLVIPRGGEALKRFLFEHARVPILAAAGGNCHVYIDESADAQMARDIVLNAKTDRPGVCNAAETVLVHEARAVDLLPLLLDDLAAAGVEVRTDEDAFATEFLGMTVAVGTVPDLESAIAHVNRYGTQHSEAIVTADEERAAAFVAGVDAAVVYVNASTRFTDGGVFGLGAEVGISTSKLHARGPIGLRELTTTKFVVHGDGHVR